MIDKFCTPEEADQLIEKARGRLTRSFVLDEGKTSRNVGRSSETALVFSWKDQDPTLLPLMYRGAMLVGVPHTHIEAIHVTRYQDGEFYKGHIDYGDDYLVNRLYTILIYLNDLDENQGGETVFNELNLAVRPLLGRAISWTNMNPDGSGHVETSHAAFPVRNGGEKWVVQLWFHPYRMFDMEIDSGPPPQTERGLPLSGAEFLPDGTWMTDGVDETRYSAANI